MGQEDYRWDRGTRDGTEGPEVGQDYNRWDRGTRDGIGGPEVGQDYYRWDGGETVRPGVRPGMGHRDKG